MKGIMKDLVILPIIVTSIKVISNKALITIIAAKVNKAIKIIINSGLRIAVINNHNTNIIQIRIIRIKEEGINKTNNINLDLTKEEDSSKEITDSRTITEQQKI